MKTIISRYSTECLITDYTAHTVIKLNFIKIQLKIKKHFLLDQILNLNYSRINLIAHIKFHKNQPSYLGGFSDIHTDKTNIIYVGGIVT